MKKFFLLLAAGTGALAASAQYNTANLDLHKDEPMTRFTLKNMCIYPVYAKAGFVNVHKDVGKYTTLSEALKQKKLTITEATEGEQVNKLYAENVSKDTIMILAGEVISGGKQDRMIANDFILPPKSGKKDLSVFCVEHGRWDYRSSGTSSAGGAGSVKGEALSFSISNSMANTKVRIAGNVTQSQADVWKEVEEVTSKQNSTTSTGTLNALNSNKDHQAKMGEYTTFYKKILTADPSIIGMVVVTGDSILGCELFATHALLMQHADNLINSYATEAMTTGSKVTIGYKKVQAYVNKLLDETKQAKLLKEHGTELKDKNKKLHLAYY
jgi:hypothetical protein